MTISIDRYTFKQGERVGVIIPHPDDELLKLEAMRCLC